MPVDASWNSLQRFTSILAHLGGPNVAPADIQWALDLNSGKRLIEWLSSQIDEAIPASGNFTEELLYSASLENIALESEEVQLLQRINGDEAPSGPSDLTGYLRPSTRRARAKYLNEESSVLESEIEVLKHRLRMTKKASQKTSQTIHSLKKAISEADDRFRQSQESIEELSISVDGTISSAMKAAISVLEQLNTSATVSREQSSRLSAALGPLRDSIIDRAESNMRSIDEFAQGIPPAELIASEVGRLTRAFGAGGGTKTLAGAAEDAAYKNALFDLCQVLDDPDSDVAQLLEGADVAEERLVQDVDVRNVLTRAWASDQATVMQAEGASMDTTLSSFNDVLIPPLRALNEEVAAIEEHTREAEVLVGALIEELEEIADNVEAGREHDASATPESKDSKLDVDLTALVKQLKELRPADAPPLVLLDHDDILNELRNIVERASAVDAREAAFSANIAGQLNSLSSLHASLSSSLYSNSPMNTSAPLRPPSHVAALEKQAGHEGQQLGIVLARLQKDTDALNSSRVQRKLGSFVDKWCREKQ